MMFFIAKMLNFLFENYIYSKKTGVGEKMMLLC